MAGNCSFGRMGIKKVRLAGEAANTRMTSLQSKLEYCFIFISLVLMAHDQLSIEYVSFVVRLLLISILMLYYVLQTRQEYLRDLVLLLQVIHQQ